MAALHTGPLPGLEATNVFIEEMNKAYEKVLSG